MRWTRKGITAEIRRLHEAGAELNYATAETRYLNLVRASAWHFGTWKMAIEAAGLDYDALSKYRRWNRALIVERIRTHHKEGKDLSWRSISVDVDPPLAAAALRPNGFASWRDALTAAGLDPNEVSRYESWNSGRVMQEIKALHRRNVPLSSKTAQQEQPKLFTAARRRFGSWDGALAAAGLNADNIRLRRPTGAEGTSRQTGAITPRVKGKAPATKVTTPEPAQLALPMVPAKSRSPRQTTPPAAPVTARKAAKSPAVTLAKAVSQPSKKALPKTSKTAMPKAVATKTPAVKPTPAKPAAAAKRAAKKSTAGASSAVVTPQVAKRRPAQTASAKPATPSTPRSVAKSASKSASGRGKASARTGKK